MSESGKTFDEMLAQSTVQALLGFETAVRPWYDALIAAQIAEMAAVEDALICGKPLPATPVTDACNEWTAEQNEEPVDLFGDEEGRS